jgi:peptidoglycan-associated lipoprotein
MSRAAIIVLCATALLGACKKAEEPTTTPATTEPGAPAAASTDEEAGHAGVVVDDAVVKLCDLPEARFDFDSAKLSPSATAMLEALATCFISGPGKDKGMRVVGHADPRGTEDYNMGLGQRRAGSVSEYLRKKGLPEDRVETSSRGELDATGSEEAGWARDRRVDILLAD